MLSSLRRASTFALWLFSSGTLAAVVSKNLDIVNKELSPDGFLRDTVVAGGTFPGPIIKGNKGDNFRINVKDSLKDTNMDVVTSVHWHGIFQHGGTNWADGGAQVNQCPIIPGDTFLYNFNVPDQAGTFWYHSHFADQYCDGLRGPFIVYDPKDPHANLYDVDDDSTVITLADWYHYLSHNAPPIPAPDSVLINGLGRYSNSTTPNSPLAVVNVQHGKRYRFRLVSISCDSNFVFSIDQHDLTVIEADGVNTKPVVVSSIQIFAAQRYSVVLNANQPPVNYWIRAKPDLGNSTYAGGLNSAILRYAGALKADPKSKDTSAKRLLLETDLHPLDRTPVPGPHRIGDPSVTTINLDVFLNATQLLFYVNNVTFKPPTVPVLLQILSGVRKPQELLPKGSIYGLKGNTVVDLIIPGGSTGGPHPVHLHGHAFHVLRSAGNSSYNFVDPVIRDTVNIGDASDEVTVRFVTDNPGPWFIHCHIDWHLTAGFAAIMAEDVEDIPQDVHPSSAWDQLCPTYNNFDGPKSNGFGPVGS